MTAVNKIDSNATGLRFAEELSYKVLPGGPIWLPLEPNSYDDFGGSVITVARNPINASRQRKKGLVTDLDASGGFEMDLTQENGQTILQGFFFASLRRKGEQVPTAATGTTDLFDVAVTAGFLVGSLVESSGWDDAANNFAEAVVTAVVVDTTVEVLAESLVTDASPAAGVNLVVVGFEGASADIDVDATGLFPALTSTILDFTTLGLKEGEWIFVGGDPAASDFVNAANNGFKRVRTIAAQRLEFDKSDIVMVDETGTAILLRLYLGRVLMNENDASGLILRRSYNLERTLGAPDDASPANIQAEYLEGCVPSEVAFNIPSANKLTANLSFVGGDNTTIDGPTSLKSGTRPALVESDAFNTSSDFSRIRLAIHVDGTEAPVPLFAFAQEMTITINNNLTPNKAIATLGAFEISHGTFAVSGNITAYFADVASVAAVRNNSNVTLDFAMVKGAAGAKSGIVMDLPLVTLGDARLNVVQDQAITLPLTMDAATAALIDPALDYTTMMVFFDHLPNAADV